MSKKVEQIIEKISININNFSNALNNTIEVETILQNRKIGYNKIISYSGDNAHMYYDIQLKTITMMEGHLNSLIETLLLVSASGSIKIGEHGEQYLNDYLDNIK